MAVRYSNHDDLTGLMDTLHKQGVILHNGFYHVAISDEEQEALVNSFNESEWQDIHIAKLKPLSDDDLPWIELEEYVPLGFYNRLALYKKRDLSD